MSKVKYGPIRKAPVKAGVGPDDVMIVIRSGHPPTFFGPELKPNESGNVVVQESFLLGYGLLRLIANREWREKVVRKAREEIAEKVAQMEDGGET